MKSELTAQPTAETVNSTADSNIVSLRPKRSLSTPATATPPIEPTSAHPTNHPCCMASSENCEATPDIVPEMTAVSYPNKIPPMAATSDRNATYPVFVCDFIG